MPGRRAPTGADGRPSVLVVGQLPPLVGGIASYVAALTTDPAVLAAVDLQVLATQPADGTPLGTVTRRNIRRSLEHVCAVRAAGRDVDVVHLNFAAEPVWPLLRSTACAAAARAAGARVILHMHTTGRAAEHARGVGYRTLLRIAGRVCDRIVTLTPAEETTVRALGGNVCRLRNGIDLGLFPMASTPPAEPTLLFAGTLTERKGLRDLSRALRLLADSSGVPPGLRVVVVGDSRQDAPGVGVTFRRELESTGVPVTFPGALPREEVHRLLLQSTAFCLPSHAEGAPISILEAMAAGVAVIATDVGAVGEMLDHGNAGYLVPAHDPAALAAAICRACSDPADRAARVASARARVAARYDLRDTGRDVLALYAEVAATRRGRRERDRTTARPKAYGTP